MSRSSVLRTASRWSVVAAFFLVPLCALPWTTDPFEPGKRLAFLALAAAALLGWIGAQLLERRTTFRTGWAAFVPLPVLAATLVSAAFSLAGYQTWVGQAAQEYASVLTTAAFLAFFYVLMNQAGDRSLARASFAALLCSAVLGGLAGVLAMFGIAPLPLDFARAPGFNPVGSFNLFAVFLEIVLFAALAAWAVSGSGRPGLLPEKKRAAALARAAIAALAAETGLVLLAADARVLWILALAGSAILALVRGGSAQGVRPSRLAVPAAIAAASVLFLLVRSPIHARLPISVLPSSSASWTIASAVLSEGGTRLAFGSGPGTFAYDYARYRPDTVNASPFWDMRFDRSASHVLTLLATTGTAGLALWSLAFLSIGFLAARSLRRDADPDSRAVTRALFAGWVVAVLAHVLHASNFTLSFLLWGLSGLLAAQVASRVRTADLAVSPRAGMAVSATLVLAAVGSAAALWAAGSAYASDMAFARAVRLDRSGASAADVSGELLRAAALNPRSDAAYRNLASAYLAQARQALAEAGTDLAPERRAAATNLVSSAVNAAKRATDLAPGNVANWVVRGAVYRGVMPIVGNAEDFAAATLARAAELEPGNPAHRVGLGRVYLAVAERARQLKESDDADLAAKAARSETDQLAAAERAFSAAVRLKPDYGPAHYYLAATYERQGRLDEAVARLSALRAAQPNDAGIGFQLAMLQMRAGKADDARAELERVVQASPTYSNALWFLASIYESQGERAKAVDAVRKVVELNPGNAAAEERLRKLEAGEAPEGETVPVEEEDEGTVGGSAVAQ